MLHHYLTTYIEDGIKYAESWIQINIFGKCFCFSRKKEKLYTVRNKPKKQ